MELCELVGVKYQRNPQQMTSYDDDRLKDENSRWLRIFIEIEYGRFRLNGMKDWIFSNLTLLCLSRPFIIS